MSSDPGHDEIHAYTRQIEDDLREMSSIADSRAGEIKRLRAENEALRDWGDPAEVCDDPWTCCVPIHRDYAKTWEAPHEQ